MRIVIISLASIGLAGLSGCGLKGPLYLPEPAKQVEPTRQPNTVEQSTSEQNLSEEEAQKKKTPAPSSAP